MRSVAPPSDENLEKQPYLGEYSAIELVQGDIEGGLVFRTETK